MDKEEIFNILKLQLKDCKLQRKNKRIKIIKDGIIVVPIVSTIVTSSIAIAGGNIKECIISGIISISVGSFVAVEAAMIDINSNNNTEYIKKLKLYLSQIKKGINPFENMNDDEMNSILEYHNKTK